LASAVPLCTRGWIYFSGGDSKKALPANNWYTYALSRAIGFFNRLTGICFRFLIFYLEKCYIYANKHIRKIIEKRIFELVEIFIDFPFTRLITV